MTEALRKLMLRQSEIRQRINTLSAEPKRTEEQDAELRAARDQGNALEVELRQSLATAGDDGDNQGDKGTDFVPAEERERLELRSRCRVMDYVGAAVSGVGVTGAAAEFAAAERCPGLMPVSMLFGSRPREERAAATVHADAVAENPAATAGEVFVSPLAARLGIMTPTVPAGVAAYPYIGTGVTPAAVAKGVAIGESSPAIQAKTVSPGSISATFTYQREEAAMLADLDSALTENIQMGLRDQFDAQIVSGDNNSPNLNGVLTQFPVTAPTTNVVTTFAEVASGTAPFLDGTYAESFEQVRLVMSPRVAHYLKALFRGTATEDDAYSWLMRTFGGITVSGRAPVFAAVNHATAGTRRAAGGGLWAVRTRVPALAYAPIWSGVQLVRDEITGAKKREVTVTAFMLVGGVVIVRPTAYTVTTIKTAAGVAP